MEIRLNQSDWKISAVLPLTAWCHPAARPVALHTYLIGVLEQLTVIGLTVDRGAINEHRASTVGLAVVDAEVI